MLRDGNDDQFRELVHGLIALSARHQQVRAGHARMIGLNPSTYTVLIAAAHLSRNSGTVLIREIADHLGVTPTYVSIETNSLRDAGLLLKERSQADSRVATIRLTEEGWEKIAQLAPTQREVNDVQFAKMTHDDFDTMHRLVQQLVRQSDAAIRLQQRLIDDMKEEARERSQG